jgi:hypothetical protein
MQRHATAAQGFFATVKAASIATCALCAIAFTPSLASAAPMIGDTSFGVGGSFHLPAGKNLSNTNAIFINGSVVVTAPDVGDLAPYVTLGLLGTLQSLPDISGFPVTGITDYLDLHNGVSVDLLSLADDGRLFSPNFSFINLSGDVIVHAPGYAPTPGVLSFTGTSTDNRTFTLAITTSATDPLPVPEPASLALLGLGLLGLFAMGRYGIGRYAIGRIGAI